MFEAVFAVTGVVNGYTFIVLVYQRLMKIPNSSVKSVWLLYLHDNYKISDCSRNTFCDKRLVAFSPL